MCVNANKCQRRKISLFISLLQLSTLFFIYFYDFYYFLPGTDVNLPDFL